MFSLMMSIIINQKMLEINYVYVNQDVQLLKVKQSRYRPGVAQRVPGS